MAQAPDFSTVEKQPGKGSDWMPKPDAETVGQGCPPGLEYLAQLDQILVHQIVEVFEAITDIEMKNKYVIKNSLGQQIFYAFEESSCCHRYWCRQGRGFTLHVVDNNQQEVMRIVRPFQCCAGCCWCATPGTYCAFTIQVEAPPGNIIGYATQSKSWWYPHLDILDDQKNTILKVRGPCCPCQTICCRGDLDFRVKTNDLSQDVGVISKQWSGWFKECITRADNFGISFPQDLDVRAKATLLAAMFLIEFQFFEQQKNNN